jgi:energy-coupling factor transport system ATP-binding protein
MGLSARGLGYTYGSGTRFSVDALRGLDLDVEPGGLLVVAGGTGSGKSTLLRLLAGLLAPTSGTVLVDGDDPASSVARGRVALVFQNPESQFFAETVLADVAFGPRNLGYQDPEGAAAAALDGVGLPAETFGARSPFTLSGGEARRAALAGILAMRAPYLLLDEPTAGLDAEGRAHVLRAVRAERERAGIVVVTHDPGEFLDGADRVLALDAGDVVLSGSVADLYANPQPYEAAGLKLPEVARIQLLAAARGLVLPPMTLDPRKAAAALLAARGVSS